MMTILDFTEGKEFELWKFLFLSVGFGLFMSLTLVSWHLSELRKFGAKNLTDEMLSSNQKKALAVSISSEELIQRLKNETSTKKMSIKESEDLIVLKTKPSWKSRGEKIQIKLDELET